MLEQQSSKSVYDSFDFLALLLHDPTSFFITLKARIGANYPANGIGSCAKR